MINLAITTTSLYLVADTSSKHHAVTCEFGLFDCSFNEECKAVSKDTSRSRNGICQCMEGYKRDALSGECVRGTTGKLIYVSLQVRTCMQASNTACYV